jgi:WD40 repeat protein
LALALEAVPQTSSGDSVPYVSEAERALATAAYEHRELRILAESTHFNNSIDEARTHGNWVIRAIFSPDGNRALTLSADAKVRLWDVADGHLLPGLEQQMQVDDRVVDGKLIVTSDGRRVVAQIWTNGKVYSPRLWNLETRQRLTVLGDDKVYTSDLAVSPDSRLIAVSRSDGTVRLWNADAGREVGVIRGENTNIAGVAFSPDSKSMAFCDGRRLRIVDTETQQQRVAADAGDNPSGTSCLPMFSPDGKLLATTSSAGVVVWDAGNGAQIAKVGEVNGRAQRIAFSPDSRSLVVLQGEKATWFDARKGTSKWLLDIYDDSVRSVQGERWLSSVAFNRDGTALVVGSHDGTATLWGIEATSGAARKVVRLKGHQSRVTDVAFSPDGKSLVTASLDATARIWDANAQPRFKAHFPRGDSAIITPDGEHLVIATGYAVSMFDVATRKKIDELKDSVLGRWLAQSPDGKELAASASGNSVLVVGDQPEGKQCELNGHTDVISEGAFGADASRLWTSSYDGTVRVWDVAACREQAVLWRGHGKHRMMRVSPDGRLVAINESGSAAVKIIDALSGAVIHEISGDRRVVFMRFSPDSRYVVTIPSGGPVHVWEARSGAHVRALPHDASMAIWSRDGSRIVTGNLLQPGKLWDAQSGALIRTLGGHVFGTDTAAFSPDGRHLVTASKGGFKLVAGPVFIWDARTGDQLATLSGADRGIDSIQFSADGAHFVTQGEQSDSILWSYFPRLDGLVDYALKAASRCLTLEQREALFLKKEPPDWCIEMQKWPYQTQDWKDWLKFKRANANPPLPDTAEWKSWIAARR